MFDLPSTLALIVFALLNLAAASSGAVFKPGEWYERLEKPFWVPPNIAFPIVWMVIFTLNTISGWMVWEAAGGAALIPMLLYGLNLVINALWSGLFFGLKRMDWALVDVVALLVSIVAVMMAFAPISPVAALLQAPYLGWVAIAAGLNVRMLQLNGVQRDAA